MKGVIAALILVALAVTGCAYKPDGSIDVAATSKSAVKIGSAVVTVGCSSNGQALAAAIDQQAAQDILIACTER